MARLRKIALALAFSLGPVLLGLAIVAWIVADDPPHGDRPGTAQPGRRPGATDDQEAIQGAWIGTVVERDGLVVYRGREARHARARFFRDRAVFEDAEAALECHFRLDPGSVPKALDLTIREGDVEVHYPSGIYRLEGDVLVICFAYPRKQRPADFTTAAGSGRTLLTYRRLSAREPGDEM